MWMQAPPCCMSHGPALLCPSAPCASACLGGCLCCSEPPWTPQAGNMPRSPPVPLAQPVSVPLGCPAPAPDPPGPSCHRIQPDRVASSLRAACSSSNAHARPYLRSLRSPPSTPQASTRAQDAPSPTRSASSLPSLPAPVRPLTSPVGHKRLVNASLSVHVSFTHTPVSVRVRPLESAAVCQEPQPLPVHQPSPQSDPLPQEASLPWSLSRPGRLCEDLIPA